MSAEQVPRVALLNLMPSAVFAQTAEQWQSLFDVGGAIDFVSVRFDDDPRLGTGCGSEQLVEACMPLSESKHLGIDALIISGANLERRADGSSLPFHDIRYYEPLVELIDWSREHSRLTVYSCLASHIALHHVYGIERDIADTKHFGVYEHEIKQDHWLGADLRNIRAPHSRWGNIGSKLLEGANIDIIADSDEAGWLLATSGNGSGGADLFIQGHPEYAAGDLDKEYKRDVSDENIVPENYYPDNNPAATPIHSWRLNSIQLFKNIRSYLNMKEQ